MLIAHPSTAMSCVADRNVKKKNITVSQITSKLIKKILLRQ